MIFPTKFRVIAKILISKQCFWMFSNLTGSQYYIDTLIRLADLQCIISWVSLPVTLI